MKTAVITGVSGMDGSILTHQLLEKGYFVIGAKRRTSTFNTQRIDDIYDNKNFKVEYFDLCDASSINRIIAKYKPDEYYNLAAQSHVKVSFDVPEDTMNGIINGTLYVLEAIRMFSPNTKLYQASSSEQFGDNTDIPFEGFNEKSKFMPASPYAIAKTTAHHLVGHYRKAYNIHASCGILFNHEGELRGDTFVTQKIANGVARIKHNKQKCIELGNLNAVRDWGYAPEYTHGMWLMLQQDKPDDYVLATRETHTVEQFLEETFKIACFDEYQKYVKINDIYKRPHEVPYLKGDYSKAKEKLGWIPKITFKDLVKIMYNNAESNLL